MQTRTILHAVYGGSLGLTALLAGGCNLIGGLSDLRIGETSSGTTSDTGGTGGTAGNGGTAGTGGAGGTTTSTDPAHCSDMTLNADETDQDCGGPTCEPCEVLKSCKVSSDCLSEVCLSDRCRAVTQLAAGNAYVCAVLDTGDLYCWGANGTGQLGTGNMVASSKPVLVSLPGVTRIATGGLPSTKSDAHTCALTTGGLVWCWGSNNIGQLGKGDTLDASSPVQLAGLSDVKRIAAGGAFTCAITSDDKVSCWGSNQFGELGDGGTAASPDPQPAPDVPAATELALGARHGCAVLADKKVACWGNNDLQQIGSETTASAAKVNFVTTLSDPTLPGTGNDATCALDSAGLWCWGDNADSQLSNALLGAMTAKPTKVDIGPAIGFALGSDGDALGGNPPEGGHACAVLATGKVTCWGNNRKGQLGRGTESPKEGASAEVAGLDAVAHVVTGAEFSCAVLETGAVRCWGRNNLGQLGTGSAGVAQFSPVPVVWP